MVAGANSLAAPSSIDTEYLSVEPSNLMSSAARIGTVARTSRCRQLKYGSTSGATAVGEVVLTWLFHHIFRSLQLWRATRRQIWRYSSIQRLTCRRRSSVASKRTPYAFSFSRAQHTEAFTFTLPPLRIVGRTKLIWTECPR